MKNIFFGLVMAAATLAACNNSNNTASENKDVNKDTVQAKPQAESPTAPETQGTSTIKEIVATYLQLKNAFTKDKSSEAATAGSALQTAFKNFDKTGLTAGQKETFGDIAGDAMEHAEHIGANGGNIAHQREHFVMLNKDMADLIKTFGNGGQTLYKDFCPMANEGKGATWFSEVKEIKNPYQGSKMLTCGSLKETIK